MADPDPRAELALLEKSLADGPPLVGYVLRGAERYFRDRALDGIKLAARAAGHELCVHDARSPEFEASKMLDDLMGSGLFSSERCVVIHNPEDLLKKAGGKDSGATTALRSFLAGGRGTVVLSAKSLRADSVAIKAIKSGGGMVSTFRPLYDSPPPWARNQDPRATELVEWLRRRAKELGVALSPDRAVLLAGSRGNDLGALDSALEEIRAGAKDEDLRATGGEAALSPFKVAETVLEGAASGPRELEALFRGGMRKDKDGTRERSPEALLAIVTGTLRNKVRQGLAAREALDAGLPPAEALQVAGFGGPPTAREKFTAQVQARGTLAWQRMLRDLVELERRSRRNIPVDVSDLTRLAVRWRPKARPRTPVGR